MKPILKIQELDFGRLDFYEDFVVSSLNEGVLFNQEKARVLSEEIVKFYQDKNFIYISHRITKYEVDPTVYVQLKDSEVLKGIAVVVKDEDLSALKTALFERNFSKKPFEVFEYLEDAIEWAEELLKK